MHLVLPMKIQSQNVRDKLHWSVRAKQKKQWYWLIRKHLKPKEPPTVPVQIAIHSHRTKKLDLANLIGGDCKPIIDTLKDLGYIKDDNPDWFRCDYDQFISKNERTEIIIYVENEVKCL